MEIANYMVTKSAKEPTINIQNKKGGISEKSLMPL